MALCPAVSLELFASIAYVDSYHAYHISSGFSSERPYLYFNIPLLGLVQARPWFQSSMWILLVAGTSKIICTSGVAGATHTCESEC